MSFFFGGKESAVPVLVKDIERLFRGGRHNDVVAVDNDEDDDDDDDDGFVTAAVTWCDDTWCRPGPVSAGTDSSCCATRGGGDGAIGRANSAAERSVAYFGGSSWLIHASCV